MDSQRPRSLEKSSSHSPFKCVLTHCAVLCIYTLLSLCSHWTGTEESFRPSLRSPVGIHSHNSMREALLHRFGRERRKEKCMIQQHVIETSLFRVYVLQTSITISLFTLMIPPPFLLLLHLSHTFPSFSHSKITPRELKFFI